MLIKIMTFDKAPKKRRENAEKLAFLLKAQIYVGGTDTLDNFIGICKSVGEDDLLYLEDDIEICSNFLTRIKKAIDAGFGDKKILLSNDDEGNGYHECFFVLTPDIGSFGYKKDTAEYTPCFFCYIYFRKVYEKNATFRIRRLY